MEELIRMLEDRYPDKVPKLGTSIEKLGVLQGQQIVVKHIIQYVEALKKKGH